MLIPNISTRTTTFDQLSSSSFSAPSGKLTCTLATSPLPSPQHFSINSAPPSAQYLHRQLTLGFTTHLWNTNNPRVPAGHVYQHRSQNIAILKTARASVEECTQCCQQCISPRLGSGETKNRSSCLGDGSRGLFCAAPFWTQQKPEPERRLFSLWRTKLQCRCKIVSAHTLHRLS